LTDVLRQNRRRDWLSAVWAVRVQNRNVVDGTKSRELDALLILEPERLVVRNRDNGSIRMVLASVEARAGLKIQQPAARD
jgi:hypothetical protein